MTNIKKHMMSRPLKEDKVEVTHIKPKSKTKIIRWVVGLGVIAALSTGGTVFHRTYTLNQEKEAYNRVVNIGDNRVRVLNKSLRDKNKDLNSKLVELGNLSMEGKDLQSEISTFERFIKRTPPYLAEREIEIQERRDYILGLRTDEGVLDRNYNSLSAVEDSLSTRKYNIREDLINLNLEIEAAKETLQK